MIPSWTLRNTCIDISNVDFWPLKTALCFLSLKKADKMSSRLPNIPFCDSLNIITLCPKTLEISGMTLLSTNLSSND